MHISGAIRLVDPLLYPYCLFGGVMIVGARRVPLPLGVLI